MRKLLPLILLPAILSLGLITKDCSGFDFVVEAQSLPATVHVVWNPSAVDSTHPAPSQYTLISDSGTPVIVDPAVSCTTTQCSVSLNIASYGAHTLTLSAQSPYISTDPSSLQSSPIVTLNWALSAGPNGPVGTKVTK